jgi:phospholipase C
VLRAGAAGMAMAAVPSLGQGVLSALAAPLGRGRLTDIDHVVIFMQENRSFDHYFGLLPGVRGFGDPAALPGVFQQDWIANATVAPAGKILPWHLDPNRGGECTNDVSHSWGTQHGSYDGGAMDRWGEEHAGDSDPTFMGYYTRDDLPYFHAVADAFTVCDGYHCSVLGSTTSNRLYSHTGMIDPDGLHGGPVRSTINWDPTSRGMFDPGWVTYPERLTDAGITWASYSDPDANYEDNPLVLFKQYYPGNPGVNTRRAAKLSANLFGHSFQDFLVAAAAGQLPQVSFVNSHINQSEHPPAAPQDGEVALSAVINALTARAGAWAKTALIYTYDENGGYFDHVAPPTAPAGTAGEFTVGDSRPIGLGFRVPTLVVSPFSRGGYVATDTFDHTSILRFLERRFGVEAPNLTDWRRATVGDLTSAFNFAGPDRSVPGLPVVQQQTYPKCVDQLALEKPRPFPTEQHMPVQPAGSRPRPSGL